MEPSFVSKISTGQHACTNLFEKKFEKTKKFERQHVFQTEMPVLRGL